MNAMSREYILLKESSNLIDDLARIDMEIASALDDRRSELEKKLEAFANSWIGEEALGLILDQILDPVLKALRIPAAAATFVGMVLEPQGRSTPREAFLMTRPALASEYRRKKERLVQIWAELARLVPVTLLPPKGKSGVALNVVESSNRCAMPPKP